MKNRPVPVPVPVPVRTDLRLQLASALSIRDLFLVEAAKFFR